MAGAFTGTALDQTVFRDHQRQTAVGQDLAVDRLAHIPDLGQSHFKAQASRAHLPLPGHVHRGGRIQVQTVVTPDAHTALPGRDQQAQIAHQHLVDANAPENIHGLLQLGHFLIVNDPGQHRADIHPGADLAAPVHILHQQMDGDVQQSGLHPKQSGCDLLPAGDLHRKGRIVPVAGKIVDLQRTAQLGHIPTGPERSKLIQHLTTHGVDSRSGEHQALLHLDAHIFAAVGGATGLCQTVGQGLSCQRCVSSRLGNRANGAAVAALGVHNCQAAAIALHHRVEMHRHKGGLHGFVALADFLQPGCVFILILPDTKHMGADISLVIAVGKALAVEGDVQPLHHGPGHIAGVDGLAVDIGDGGHIFRPLHPALQLDGGNTHGLQFLQFIDQAVILQT